MPWCIRLYRWYGWLVCNQLYSSVLWRSYLLNWKMIGRILSGSGTTWKDGFFAGAVLSPNEIERDEPGDLLMRLLLIVMMMKPDGWSSAVFTLLIGIALGANRATLSGIGIPWAFPKAHRVELTRGWSHPCPGWVLDMILMDTGRSCKLTLRR